MRIETRKWNHQFIMDMISEAPVTEKKKLYNALNRNNILTTYYGLDWQSVTVYKEGWYMVFRGCRCQFTMWVANCDGVFVFGKRKTIERKLNRLYAFDPEISSFDFDELIEGVCL